ncbi:MAG: ATP-binding cassette domain-containing protein [Gemmatimonadaceae bacterium]
MPTALRVHNLWKSYAAGVLGCSARVWALRACSFDLDMGERIAIVGARGAGKSTLLRCIAGERRMDAGRIDVALPIRRWFSDSADVDDDRARLASSGLLLLDDQELPVILRRLDGTMIVASRDVASVQGLVDRILLLRDGHIAPLTRVAVRRVAERIVQ